MGTARGRKKDYSSEATISVSVLMLVVDAYIIIHLDNTLTTRVASLIIHTCNRHVLLLARIESFLCSMGLQSSHCDWSQRLWFQDQSNHVFKYRHPLTTRCDGRGSSFQIPRTYSEGTDAGVKTRVSTVLCIFAPFDKLADVQRYSPNH